LTQPQPPSHCGLKETTGERGDRVIVAEHQLVSPGDTSILAEH
jgi:hypothetical protein